MPEMTSRIGLKSGRPMIPVATSKQSNKEGYRKKVNAKLADSWRVGEKWRRIEKMSGVARFDRHNK